MDFIRELPSELLFTLLLWLRLDDVLACMLVCRAWHNKISTLSDYWSTAVSILGVAGRLKALSPRYKDFRELAIAAHRNRCHLASSTARVTYITSSYPPDYYFQCNYTRFGLLVGTLYNDFHPVATTMEALQPGTCTFRKVHEFDPLGFGPQNRIIWAHVFAENNYLVLVSASGHWKGINFTSTGHQTVLDWQGPSLYDSSIMFSCCEHCQMVTIARLVSQRRPKESYWDVYFVRIKGGDQASPLQYHYRLGTPFIISPLLAGYGCKKAALVSKETDGKGFCKVHNLYLQWADTVYIYKLILSASIVHEEVAVLRTSNEDVVACISNERMRNTEFVLSADSLILGLIFKDQLHVWDLQSYTKQVTTKSLRLKAVDGKVCLVEVGHLYTVVGFESIEGLLLVVSTYTGQTIFATRGFSGRGMLDHRERSTGIPPPYFSFLGVVDQLWLSSIENYTSSSMPALMFWDKARHCVAGILFHNKSSLPVQTPPNATRNTQPQRRWRRILKFM